MIKSSSKLAVKSNKIFYFRVWKEYFAVLKNHSLFFYKEEQDALQVDYLQIIFGF